MFIIVFIIWLAVRFPAFLDVACSLSAEGPTTVAVLSGLPNSGSDWAL